MKCKRHPSEQDAGVCAPCLRDRLLILLADQHNHHYHPSSSRRSKKKGTSSPPSLFLPPLESTTTIPRRFSLFPTVFASDDSETSSSWISSLIHRRRAKEKMVRLYGPSVRGMSPAIDGDASGRGYSTESPAGVRSRTTPARTTDDCRRRRRRGGRGLADYVVCLSPLVRPGPTRRRRRDHAKESGFSGELGRNGKPVHFGPNQSRKLADRSRFR